MNVELNYHISPVWELIEKVENKTKDIFQVNDKELKSATLMTVTELLENAVKYGKANPEIEGIEFNFTADDNRIIILVTNAVITESHARQIREHIAQVNATSNPEILYVNRLKELLENRKKGESKLGIYRIAYEGQFKLSCQYHNNILTVKAEREYSSGEEK